MTLGNFPFLGSAIAGALFWLIAGEQRKKACRIKRWIIPSCFKLIWWQDLDIVDLRDIGDEKGTGGKAGEECVRNGKGAQYEKYETGSVACSRERFFFSPNGASLLTSAVKTVILPRCSWISIRTRKTRMHPLFSLLKTILLDRQGQKLRVENEPDSF